MASHEQPQTAVNEQQKRLDAIAERTEQIQDTLVAFNDDKRVDDIRNRATQILAGLGDPAVANETVVKYGPNQELSEDEVLARKIAGNYLDAVAIHSEVGSGETEQEVRFALPFNADEGRMAPDVLPRKWDETTDQYDERLAKHAEEHRDKLFGIVEAQERTAAESSAEQSDEQLDNEDLGLLGKSPQEALALLLKDQKQEAGKDKGPIKVAISGEALDAFNNAQGRVRNLRQEYAAQNAEPDPEPQKSAINSVKLIGITEGAIDTISDKGVTFNAGQPQTKTPAEPESPQKAPVPPASAQESQQPKEKVSMFERAKQLAGKFAEKGLDKIQAIAESRATRATVAAIGVAAVSLAMAAVSKAPSAQASGERAVPTNNTPENIQGSSGGPGSEAFKNVALDVKPGGGITDAIKDFAAEKGIDASPEELKSVYDELKKNDAIGSKNTYQMMDGSLGINNPGQPIFINQQLLEEQIDKLQADK